MTQKNYPPQLCVVLMTARNTSTRKSLAGKKVQVDQHLHKVSSGVKAKGD